MLMFLLLSADFLQNLPFFKNSFRNTIRVLNSSDPDDDRHSDLCSNGLQRQHQESTKVGASKERAMSF